MKYIEPIKKIITFFSKKKRIEKEIMKVQLTEDQIRIGEAISAPIIKEEEKKKEKEEKIEKIVKKVNKEHSNIKALNKNKQILLSDSDFKDHDYFLSSDPNLLAEFNVKPLGYCKIPNQYLFCIKKDESNKKNIPDFEELKKKDQTFLKLESVKDFEKYKNHCVLWKLEEILDVEKAKGYLKENLRNSQNIPMEEILFASINFFTAIRNNYNSEKKTYITKLINKARKEIENDERKQQKDETVKNLKEQKEEDEIIQKKAEIVEPKIQKDTANSQSISADMIRIVSYEKEIAGYKPTEITSDQINYFLIPKKEFTELQDSGKLANLKFNVVRDDQDFERAKDGLKNGNVLDSSNMNKNINKKQNKSRHSRN